MPDKDWGRDVPWVDCIGDSDLSLEPWQTIGKDGYVRARGAGDRE